jgi:hypothetical protein
VANNIIEMKEFYVNEYITLKLKNGKTIIYVAGERFRQCKYLLINIPTEKIGLYEEFKSIDEVAKKLDPSLEDQNQRIRNISPETEFWAHSSNLQTWYESGYNPDLLHSNIAFPLLKKLTDAGDQLSKQVFIEEITKRIITGHIRVIEFFFEENCIEYLDKNTLQFLIREIKEDKFNLREIYLDIRFTILERLMIVGDLESEKRFKREILEIISENDLSLINLLYLNGYINYLNRKEFWDVFGEDGKILFKLEQKVRRFEIDNKNKEKLKKFEYFKLQNYIHIGYGPMCFKFENGRITGIGIFGDEKGVQKASQGELDLINGTIGNLKLKKLPNSIYKLEALEELFLWNIRLKSLPKSIEKLKNLKKISIKDNLQISNCLWRIVSLEMIDLERNNIRYVPETIRNLKNLRELYLQDNKIKQLPESIKDLKQLTVLNLKGNPLNDHTKKIAEKIKKNKQTPKSIVF